MQTENVATGALERWRELIDARKRQMDAAYAALERTSGDYWDRRAATFHQATRGTAEHDPLFTLIEPWMGPRSSVLDVGAGTGRFTLALAPLVEHVTAVEPNAAMRSYLIRESEARGLTNVTVVPTTWEDAPEDLGADLVLCVHVLYPIADAQRFLAKLQRASRGRCVLYMRALQADTVTNPLWEHFHHQPRVPSPSYVDAVDVLAEMGIFANVQVFDVPSNWNWDTLDEAEEHMLDMLILPDTPATRAELRPLLADFLVTRDGRLGLPTPILPSAAVWWSVTP